MSDSEREETVRSADNSIPALLIDEGDSLGSGDAGRYYKYKDYAKVKEDDDLEQAMPPPATSNRGNSETSIRVQKFPVKLYAILAQKEFQDIITWMPHGRSWKVLKPSMFESLVMPLFFEYSNYHSFNRLVNAWSFRRIASGPDRGSYYHELFLRGKPHLQKYMRRLPKTHKKLPTKRGEEPNFYKLRETSPLPALEDAPVPGAAATSLAMQRQEQGMHPSQHMVSTPPPPGSPLAAASGMPMQRAQTHMPPYSSPIYGNPTPEVPSSSHEEYDATHQQPHIMPPPVTLPSYGRQPVAPQFYTSAGGAPQSSFAEQEQHYFPYQQAASPMSLHHPTMQAAPAMRMMGTAPPPSPQENLMHAHAHAHQHPRETGPAPSLPRF